MAELIASEGELSGLSRRSKQAAPKALSVPSSCCLCNQGSKSCGSYSALGGKKGTWVRAAVSQWDHAPRKIALNSPSSGLVVAGQQPFEGPAMGELCLWMLRGPRARSEFAGQEQASLGPRHLLMEQMQIWAKMTGPSI